MPTTHTLTTLSNIPLKHGHSGVYPFGPVFQRSSNMALNGACPVTFRLYAPDAETVELALENDPERPVFLPMACDGSGWFSVSTEQASVGSLYQFRVNNGLSVPDPASRFQPQGVMGPSQVVDAHSFQWQDVAWKGLPWRETIIYELHIGTFSETGDYAGVEAHLDYLAELGITAIELLPVSSFAGERNWGYDGVYPYAPSHNYGTPDQLKHLVDAAHARGLMVFLDVVYNHFGPEGNFLHQYAESFFTDRHQTPWGAGINLDSPDSAPVRDFFIQNALYWIEEFHFDGLRLDAVHTIQDDSPVPMLVELAERVQNGPGQDRHVHLILENDANRASWLHGHDSTGFPMPSNLDGAGASHSLTSQSRFPACYTAQWNDDAHHILHVLATGQSDSYYVDYADKPIEHLATALSEGFAYQGQTSILREGQPRGESSAHLPSTAFINFLQNHDQIGNHPLGSRGHEFSEEAMLRANITLLLLAPQIPMLFMGEEWQAKQRFPFFCDFHDELAALVTEGRRREFAHVPGFNDPEEQKRIPDPNHANTFKSAILNGSDRHESQHQAWLEFYKHLIGLRKQTIIPMLQRGLGTTKPQITVLSDKVLMLCWEWQANPDSQELQQLWLIGNWGIDSFAMDSPSSASLLAESTPGSHEHLKTGTLPPETVLWLLSPHPAFGHLLPMGEG